MPLSSKDILLATPLKLIILATLLVHRNAYLILKPVEAFSLNTHHYGKTINSNGRITEYYDRPRKRRHSQALAAASFNNDNGDNNILILDHLNINHEKGRHDLLKNFYFNFLECAVDPRKEENLVKGSKTLWANIGANQFHLPEGKPSAQVLEGIVTLSYPSIDYLRKKLKTSSDSNPSNLFDTFRDSKFSIEELSSEQDDSSDYLDGIMVTDPWGTKFKIIEEDKVQQDIYRSTYAIQKGGPSVGLALKDLTIYTGKNCNMNGIARFYNRILGAPIIKCTNQVCVIHVGPSQTLTFKEHPTPATIVGNSEVDEGGLDKAVNIHVDLREEPELIDEGKPFSMSNYGPHISMYVADIRSTYKRAEALGVTYVNPRFKRRAYNEEETVDDCMFRCIDIIDPDDIESGVIIRLEHEIRSVVKRDGSKYKSCPFIEIPEGCVI